MDDAKTRVMQRPLPRARAPRRRLRRRSSRRSAARPCRPRSGAAASLLPFLHLRESARCDGLPALPDAAFNRWRYARAQTDILAVVRRDRGGVLLAIALIVVSD